MITHAWVTSLKSSGSPPLSGCNRSALEMQSEAIHSRSLSTVLLAVRLLQVGLRCVGRYLEEIVVFAVDVSVVSCGLQAVGERSRFLHHRAEGLWVVNNEESRGTKGVSACPPCCRRVFEAPTPILLRPSTTFHPLPFWDDPRMPPALYGNRTVEVFGPWRASPAADAQLSAYSE